MNILKLLFTLHYKRCSQNVYQLKRICQRHVIIMPTIEFSWTKAQVKWEPLYDHLISVFPLHAWKRIHLIVIKMKYSHMLLHHHCIFPIMPTYLYIWYINMNLVLIIYFRLPGQGILMLVQVEEKKGGHSQIAVYCCFTFISPAPNAYFLLLAFETIKYLRRNAYL